MRDLLTWCAALLVVASIALAIWCTRIGSVPPTPAEDVSALTFLEPPRGTPPTHAANPRQAACDFGEVLVIAATEDPRYASTALRLQNGATETLRTGESVRGHVVEAIHWDRVRFRRGETTCDLHIGEAPVAVQRGVLDVSVL